MISMVSYTQHSRVGFMEEKLFEEKPFHIYRAPLVIIHYLNSVQSAKWPLILIQWKLEQSVMPLSVDLSAKGANNLTLLGQHVDLCLIDCYSTIF